MSRLLSGRRITEYEQNSARLQVAADSADARTMEALLVDQVNGVWPTAIGFELVRLLVTDRIFDRGAG
jgi:hypothetical protein